VKEKETEGPGRTGRDRETIMRRSVEESTSTRSD